MGVLRIKQYTNKEFETILRKNEYKKIRYKGSHQIFKNRDNVLSIPIHLNCCIARRLIKEYKLNV